jgi:hypothetical protein
LAAKRLKNAQKREFFGPFWSQILTATGTLAGQIDRFGTTLRRFAEGSRMGIFGPSPARGG